MKLCLNNSKCHKARYIFFQADREAFNRGMLMNVGFREAMLADNFTCVIFHDVDLIPEDARNDYSCPSSPRHMSTAVNRMDYKLVVHSTIIFLLHLLCTFSCGEAL